MKHFEPESPEWYSGARDVDRQYLKELIEEHGRLQGALDRPWCLAARHQRFCRAITECGADDGVYGVENIDTLSVQLVVPSKIGFVIDSGASHVRQSTLLEAALHNFDASETTDDALA